MLPPCLNFSFKLSGSVQVHFPGELSFNNSSFPELLFSVFKVTTGLSLVFLTVRLNDCSIGSFKPSVTVNVMLCSLTC